MKRFLIFSTTFLLCSMFVGCSSDSSESLVSDTISQIGVAEVDVQNIQKAVNKAIKDHNESKPFSLEEAMKQTKSLKRRIEEAQKLKGRIERARGAITDEQKKSFAEKKRNELREVVKKLLDQNALLDKALNEAEKIDKPATDKLREQIRDAEGPFEAMARQ